MYLPPRHRTHDAFKRDKAHTVRFLPAHDEPRSYMAVVSRDLSLGIALTLQKLLKSRDFPVCPRIGASDHEIVCKRHMTITRLSLRSMTYVGIRLRRQLRKLCLQFGNLAAQFGYRVRCCRHRSRNEDRREKNEPKTAKSESFNHVILQKNNFHCLLDVTPRYNEEMLALPLRLSTDTTMRGSAGRAG